MIFWTCLCICCWLGGYDTAAVEEIRADVTSSSASPLLCNTQTCLLSHPEIHFAATWHNFICDASVTYWSLYNLDAQCKFLKIRLKHIEVCLRILRSKIRCLRSIYLGFLEGAWIEDIKNSYSLSIGCWVVNFCRSLLKCSNTNNQELKTTPNNLTTTPLLV